MSQLEFLIEKKGEGYQRAQVDAYIRELRQTYQQMYEAYQMAHRDFTALEKRYGELQMKYQALEAESQAQKQMAQMTQQAGLQYPGYQSYPMPAVPYGTAAPYGTPSAMPYEMTTSYGAPASAPYGTPAAPDGYYY